jgi:hypothetical protein
MLHVATAKEQRGHPRARLHLPVRLRWRGPLGSLVEVTETLDTSREGLLIYRQEETREGSRVWVTFPFDAAATNAVQPETRAHVVRVQSTAAGGHQVALHFERPRRNSLQGHDSERRANPRVSFGLPLLVRPANFPWPEETMTLDISRSGARFEAARKYAVGDSVGIQILPDTWTAPKEVPARVMRFERALDSPTLDRANGDGEAEAELAIVAIRWETSPAFT